MRAVFKNCRSHISKPGAAVIGPLFALSIGGIGDAERMIILLGLRGAPACIRVEHVAPEEIWIRHVKRAFAAIKLHIFVPMCGHIPACTQRYNCAGLKFE